MHLLFHIGSPKAGSTTIQQALQQSAGVLREQGVLAWEADNSRGPAARTLANAFARNEKPLLPRERLFFDDRKAAIAWSRENWDRLAAQVAAEKPDLTILSSENFYEMHNVRPVLDRLRAIFSQITILAYVRDPVAQFRSMLDQRIRDGDRLADLPVPGSQVQRGEVALENYRKHLGPENVRLRAFDRRNFPGGDLIADVFAQIEAVLGRPLPPAPELSAANESLCAAATLWLLGANEAFIRFGKDDRELVRRRIDLIRRLSKARELTALPKLTDPDERVAIWIRHANREAIEYFNRVALSEQIPLKQAPADTMLPPEAEMRAGLRDWLFSNARPEDLARVLHYAVV
ncbi:MAG: hypothetical protein ACK4GT_00445 [Pararhodobacter sp.]